MPFLCRNAATGESAWVRPSPMPPGEPPVPPMPPVEFRINVKLPNKKVIVVEVSSSDLPWQVRKRAEPIACMGSLDETTLVYGVEEMEETLCLAVYEVVSDSTIRIVSKPQSQATGDEKSTGNPGNPVGVVAAAKSVTGPCPLCDGDRMRPNDLPNPICNPICKGDHHDPRLHAAAVPSIPMSPRGLGQPPHQFREMSPGEVPPGETPTTALIVDPEDAKKLEEEMPCWSLTAAIIALFFFWPLILLFYFAKCCCDTCCGDCKGFDTCCLNIVTCCSCCGLGSEKCCSNIVTCCCCCGVCGQAGPYVG